MLSEGLGGPLSITASAGMPSVILPVMEVLVVHIVHVRQVGVIVDSSFRIMDSGFVAAARRSLLLRYYL